MHQSTTPSLSQTIWLRWASRQFVTLPIVQTLLPVTFGYSLSSEAVVMLLVYKLKSTRYQIKVTKYQIKCETIILYGLNIENKTKQKQPYKIIPATPLHILEGDDIYIYIYIYIYISLHTRRVRHKVNFKRSLTGLSSEFSFSLTSCLTKAEEPSLPYYLPITVGRIIGFIPFQWVLVLWERQLVWSKIWTRVTQSISYDGNHYTTSASLRLCNDISNTV